MPAPREGLLRPVTFCATGRIATTPERVFTLLTDPAHMERWLPGCGGIASDEAIGPGVHVRARFGHRATEFVVVDFGAPYRFGWAESGRRTGWRVWFRLNTAGRETALTVCEVWAPVSLFAWLWGHVARRRHPERYVEQILTNLRTMIAP